VDSTATVTGAAGEDAAVGVTIGTTVTGAGTAETEIGLAVSVAVGMGGDSLGGSVEDSVDAADAALAASAACLRSSGRAVEDPSPRTCFRYLSSVPEDRDGVSRENVNLPLLGAGALFT